MIKSKDIIKINTSLTNETIICMFLYQTENTIVFLVLYDNDFKISSMELSSIHSIELYKNRVFDHITESNFNLMFDGYLEDSEFIEKFKSFSQKYFPSPYGSTYGNPYGKTLYFMKELTLNELLNCMSFLEGNKFKVQENYNSMFKLFVKCKNNGLNFEEINLSFNNALDCCKYYNNIIDLIVYHDINIQLKDLNMLTEDLNKTLIGLTNGTIRYTTNDLTTKSTLRILRTVEKLKDINNAEFIKIFLEDYYKYIDNISGHCLMEISSLTEEEYIDILKTFTSMYKNNLLDSKIIINNAIDILDLKRDIENKISDNSLVFNNIVIPQEEQEEQENQEGNNE